MEREGEGDSKTGGRTSRNREMPMRSARFNFFFFLCFPFFGLQFRGFTFSSATVDLVSSLEFEPVLSGRVFYWAGSGHKVGIRLPPA